MFLFHYHLSLGKLSDGEENSDIFSDTLGT